MHEIKRIPGKGRFRALIGAVLAASLLAASPAGALTAPTLSATAGDGKVELTWTVSPDTHYTQWQISLDGGSSWAAWCPLVMDGWCDTIEIANQQKRLELTGLKNGTAYTFRMRGMQLGHGGWSPTTGYSNEEPVYSGPSNTVTVTPTAGK